MPEEASEFTTSVESVLSHHWALPIWLWIVYAFLALLFAAWVYWSERGSAPLVQRSVLAGIRFLLLMSLLWMLSGWTLRQYRTERPELAIVLDRSASMATKDGPNLDNPGKPHSRLVAVTRALQGLSPGLRRAALQKYQIKWFTVAESLEPTPSLFDESSTQDIVPDGTQSKLGENLTQLVERQSSRGSAAILFFSDGINTAGPGLEQAEKAARLATIPIYSISTGRDFTLPDIRLSDLLLDKEVYYGDRVTVEASVTGSDIQQETVVVVLREANTGRKLDETRVTLNADTSQQNVRLSFVPTQAGEIPIEIEASPLRDELDLANNSSSQVVTVHDMTLKVFLVQQTPSYEFRFLKHLLERSNQAGESRAASFELHSVLQDSDPMYVDQDSSALRLVPSEGELLVDTDVFIFGAFDPQLVSRRSQQAIFEAVTKHGAGCIFVYGSGAPAVDLLGWPLGDLLPVTSQTSQLPAASLSQNLRWQPTPLGMSTLPMQLASSASQSVSIWQSLPGPQSLCTVGDLKMGGQVLATAEDGTVSYPVLVAQYAGAGRVVLQASAETYRWTSYLGADVYHQRYWEQLIRWASRGKLRSSAEKSSLTIEPRQAKVGQSIRVEATIGSEVAEDNLPAASTVSLTTDQQAGRTLTLTRSSRSNRIYFGTASDLSPGKYRALLVHPASDDPPTQEFTIAAPPGEQADLRANVPAMQSLAAVSRGRYYDLQSLQQVFDDLPTGKPSRLGSLPPLSLWNRWWVALVFVGLITSEWIIRRRARML